MIIQTTLIPIVSKIGTPSFRRAVVDLIPSEHIKKIRDIVDVFYSTSVEIFESKKKALREGDQALAAQIGRGKDIISILSKNPCIFSPRSTQKNWWYSVRANMESSEEDKLSDNELLGQVTWVGKIFWFLWQNTHISDKVPWLLQPLTRHQALYRASFIFSLSIRMYRRRSAKKYLMQRRQMEGKILIMTHWFLSPIWMLFVEKHYDCKILL